VTEIDLHLQLLLRRLTTLCLVVAIFISVGTYFSALSQYPTADQDLTSLRLNAFIADFRSVAPVHGSLVSNVVVAIPGHFVAKLLDAVYQNNDPIIGNIRYTSIFPLALAQVVVALGLILFLTHLVVRLACTERPALTTILFSLIVILNFPILKAICKVLKYDALSTLFSAIAIVLYIAYRQYDGQPSSAFFGRFCVAATAMFCGLAFLEKDTSISVVLLIVAFELAVIPFVSANRLKAVLSAVRFGAVFGVAFLATTILLLPNILVNLGQLPDLFEGIPQYFVNLPRAATLAFSVVLLAAYTLGPLTRGRWSRADQRPVMASACLSVAALGILTLAASALVFQDNILYDPNIPGNDIDLDALRAQGIYVSQPIAFGAITTLDHSAWMQHIKILYSMVRATFYTVPELIVLLIVGAAPLYLLLARKNRVGRRDGAILLFLLFPAAMLTAYSLADIPFDPKYLVLASLLLTIFGLFPVLLALERVRTPIGHAIQMAVAALMLVTALSAAPSYLRYKNIFRDRALENAAAIDMNHYGGWTWPGWGETAYAIAQHLESQGGGPTTVAYDYRAPFYSVPHMKWIRADFDKCHSEDELKARLGKIARQAPDYLIVSKNMSNRNWCLNGILRRIRSEAVFVDVQQGFEYGWLFRFDDVMAKVPK
jgi:hypothetical protein